MQAEQRLQRALDQFIFKQDRDAGLVAILDAIDSVHTLDDMVTMFAAKGAVLLKQESTGPVAEVALQDTVGAMVVDIPAPLPAPPQEADEVPLPRDDVIICIEGCLAQEQRLS
jgi:hypothetical protein